MRVARRGAGHPWRAARGAAAPRVGWRWQPSGPSDQRRRMAARHRPRGLKRAVGTLNLAGAAGTRPILPSAPCRSVGPTVPPSGSERPAALREPRRLGPTWSPSRAGPRARAPVTDPVPRVATGRRPGRASPTRPGNRSSPRRRRRGLDLARSGQAPSGGANPEHLGPTRGTGAGHGGFAILHGDRLRVLDLDLLLVLDAVRLGHYRSLPFVTVDVVGHHARRSSAWSDTGSAQPSGADSANPTDPGQRELAQR